MDAVEDIKSRLSIEDVISQYVELKRAGRNFKALSPFGNERTPSFMVSPEKQIWHDFSSGKGGNMFSFVMEMEGVDFKGALELLARKAGVDLEQYRGKQGSYGKNKERIYEVLEMATRFYQQNLIKSALAVDYVSKKRKFTRQTAFDWRLGYSPDTGSALVDHLQKKGFSAGELKQAGLSTQRYSGLGDMFRGRLMIPLQDPQGRVIGFTARLLKDDPDAPKYINTPQTVLYDKSRHVYGLHFAKEALRKSKYAVLTEGNLDVIQSHQAGVKQVVATAGTALTEYHLKTLNHFTNDIRLCFDADSAGLNATERAIPIANKIGVSLSILSIPDGKDPDDLIKKDPNAWEYVIETKEDVLDWLITRYKNLSDLTTDRGRKDFKRALLGSLRKLESPGEQSLYAKKIADILNYSAGSEAILAEMRTMEEGRDIYSSRIKIKERNPVLEDKKLTEARKLQNHLLSIALVKPELRKYLSSLKPQMLPEEEAGSLLTFLQGYPSEVKDPGDITPLRPLADYAKMLLLLFEELYQDLESTELHYEATQLQASLVRIYVRNQKQRIVRELQASDDARTAELLEAVKKLDNLLKVHKGG